MNGYSIHVGVNDYSWWRGLSARRQAWLQANNNSTVGMPFVFQEYPFGLPLHNLRNPVNDCNYMYDLARSKGFEHRIRLTDGDATALNVFKAFTLARSAASPGDLVMFTFAGHGINRGDTHGPERDTGLVLSDAWLSDDVLRMFFRGFPEGVRILLVVDACRSGGILDVDGSEKDYSVQQLEDFKGYLGDVRYRHLLDAWVQRYGGYERDGMYTTAVQALTAVTIDESANDGVGYGNGYFTWMLKGVLEEAAAAHHSGDYGWLIHRVKAKLREAASADKPNWSGGDVLDAPIGTSTTDVWRDLEPHLIWMRSAVRLGMDKWQRDFRTQVPFQIDPMREGDIFNSF